MERPFLNPSQSGLTRGLTAEGLPSTRDIFDARRRSGWRKIVISCEELPTLAAAQMRMLAAMTEGSPVSIVYYVRRWSELVASAWQEYVKQGSTLQLVEVLVHNLRDAARSRIINIDLSLGIFATVFGRGALRLVPYSALMDDGTDIFANFAEGFLDSAAVVPPPRRIMNPSFPAEKIELLRVFNCMERDAGGDRTRGLIRFSRVGAWAGAVDKTDGVLAKYRPRPSKLTFIRPDYGLTPGFAEAARPLRQDLLALEGLT